MAIRVMKFGGTSVADAERIHHAAQLVAQEGEPGGVVTVVSAMSGVTTQLSEAVHAAERGDLGPADHAVLQVRSRFDEAANDLISQPETRAEVREAAHAVLEKFLAVCRSVAVLGEATPRVADAAISCGEPLVGHLLAAHLRELGREAVFVEPEHLVVTDDRFGDASPRLEETRERVEERLKPLLERGVIPVTGGFIGATAEGIKTTLGRGGSDFSAAILGAALPADEVIIWTDVDGVMTADPRRVDGARVIGELTYAEVAELAHFGAKVLHPRTIRPLVERRIPLMIRNSFRPEEKGTRVVSECPGVPSGIRAVTDVGDLSLVIVEGRGMLGVPGIAARTFACVAACEANVLLISQASSEQSICFVIPSSDAECVQRGLEEEFRHEIERRQIDRIRAHEDVAIVTALGHGIRSSAGAAGRVFGAAAEAEVNVVAIAQGSSEYAISLVVGASDQDRAVRAIHREVMCV